MNTGTLRPQNCFFIGKPVSFFPSTACMSKSPQIFSWSDSHNPRLRDANSVFSTSFQHLESLPTTALSATPLYLLKPPLSQNFTNYYLLLHLLLNFHFLSSNTILLPDIFSPQHKLHSAKEEDSVQCILYLPREYSKTFLPKNIYYHVHSKLYWAGKESQAILSALLNFIPSVFVS